MLLAKTEKGKKNKRLTNNSGGFLIIMATKKLGKNRKKLIFSGYLSQHSKLYFAINFKLFFKLFLEGGYVIFS